MSVQRYFDRIAEEFDSYYGEPRGALRAWTNRTLRRPGIVRRLRIALEVLDRGTDREILDIGCGSGVLTIPLARSGHRVTGIDFSAAMIEIAKAHAKEAGVSAEFRVADFATGEFHDVDGCAALGVFEYFARPQAMIEKMLRITRPGGHVVFDLPALWNYHTPLRAPYLLWRRQRAWFHTRASIRRLLAPMGGLIAATEIRTYGAGFMVVLTRR